MYGDFQGFTGIYGYSQGFTGTYEDSQGFTGIYRGLRGCTEIPRDLQGFPGISINDFRNRQEVVKFVWQMGPIRPSTLLQIVIFKNSAFRPFKSYP